MNAALELGLALVFAAAALGKALNREEVERYVGQLIRAGVGRWVTALIGFEAVLVLALITAVPVNGLGPVAGLLCAVFLSLATCFQGALLIGGKPPECNCFGQVARSRGTRDRSWGPALFGVRNAVLVAVSLNIAGIDWGLASGLGSAMCLVIASALIVSVLLIHRAIMGDRHNPRVDFWTTQMSELQARGWWVDGEPRKSDEPWFTRGFPRPRVHGTDAVQHLDDATEGVVVRGQRS